MVKGASNAELKNVASVKCHFHEIDVHRIGGTETGLQKEFSSS